MQSEIVKIGSYVLLPVPMELFEEIGLNPMDVMQFSVADEKIIIEKVTDDDFVCDGDCESCPFNEEDCDGNCENCPCGEYCEDADEKCLVSDSCEKCPYHCPHCGECLCDENKEDFEDE